MSAQKEVTEIDPDANWCPWCHSVRRWKGRHAAAKHPEKWASFKSHFKQKSGKTEWVKHDEGGS